MNNESLHIIYNRIWWGIKASQEQILSLANNHLEDEVQNYKPEDHEQQVGDNCGQHCSNGRCYANNGEGRYSNYGNKSDNLHTFRSPPFGDTECSKDWNEYLRTSAERSIGDRYGRLGSTDGLGIRAILLCGMTCL